MVFGVNCCLLASVPRFAGVTGLAAGRKVSLSFWISATNLSSVRWATLAAFLACFFACLFFSPGDVEEEDEEVEEGEGLRYFFFFLVLILLSSVTGGSPVSPSRPVTVIVTVAAAVPAFVPLMGLFMSCPPGRQP